MRRYSDIKKDDFSNLPILKGLIIRIWKIAQTKQRDKKLQKDQKPQRIHTLSWNQNHGESKVCRRT